MILRNTRHRWGAVAIAFHWTMAVIILVMIPLLFLYGLSIALSALAGGRKSS